MIRSSSPEVNPQVNNTSKQPYMSRKEPTIQPTNAVILARLKGFKKVVEVELKQINTHLEKLNGKVEKNTKWRWEGKIYIAIGAFVISSAVGLIINEFL